MPYRALRVPSNVAVTMALAAKPPDATTPTAANWLAPEKVRSEKRQVCRTEKPPATPRRPKRGPVGTDGQRHAQRIANSPSGQVRHLNILAESNNETEKVGAFTNLRERHYSGSRHVKGDGNVLRRNFWARSLDRGHRCGSPRLRGSAIPKLARNLGSAKTEFEKGLKSAKNADGSTDAPTPTTEIKAPEADK